MTVGATVEIADFETYRGELTGYCYRMLGSGFEAEDAVQETMIKAFKSLDSFREGTDLKAWLLTIVRNCWRSAGTASKRRGYTVLDEDLVAPQPDPEVLAVQAGTRRKLDAMIAQLPEEFREVLILREIEDLSYREIAAIVKTHIGTVMSRLARARAMLKEKWIAEEHP